MLARMMLAMGIAVMGITCVAEAQAQTLLQAGARYPRVRLLPSGELIATVLLFPNDYRVRVFSSTDNGATFTPVGIVSEPNFLTARTSSPDFIVLPNGHLILALNVDTSKCATCRSKIRVFRSTDNGRNWSYISTAATAANNQGFWEPNFSIASDGALVLTYADETSTCCSQKIVKVRSYDNGVTWEDRANVVALGTSSTIENQDPRRPGMPVVTKLTDGTGRWFMTYEICNLPSPNNCRTYYKTSTDGWNYGAESAAGTAMTGSLGRYFNATPVNKTVPDGTLLWIGQMLHVADGSFSAANGQILFKSPSGNPNGPWDWMVAPVPIADVQAPGCEGFSPGLQWVSTASGYRLIHITSRLNSSTNVCDMYFGSSPL
ncbi:sialidase family protein [Sphingomonas sp. AOB5]|uniref:sialidase family protein n=1 Tax=Sphingomonas sp. AOB5 TaxID=3034017 RepID=UPI0023F8A989|nr:sialidase family protein [Sphingomonas sp. AOB5]MDF7776437.1 sialidase family protein [Sphingomonas sp. AOB5]